MFEIQIDCGPKRNGSTRSLAVVQAPHETAIPPPSIMAGLARTACDGIDTKGLIAAASEAAKVGHILGLPSKPKHTFPPHTCLVKLHIAQLQGAQATLTASLPLASSSSLYVKLGDPLGESDLL